MTSLRPNVGLALLVLIALPVLGESGQARAGYVTPAAVTSPGSPSDGRGGTDLAADVGWGVESGSDMGGRAPTDGERPKVDPNQVRLLMALYGDILPQQGGSGGMGSGSGGGPTVSPFGLPPALLPPAIPDVSRLAVHDTFTLPPPLASDLFHPPRAAL